MSLKEADRLSVMRQVDKKILSLGKAAEELDISLRQAKRIRKRYLQEGEKGLISKHKGKISPNRIDPKLRAIVLKILNRDEYAGFGPTFASEKLKERHGYHLSEETLRKWMTEDGLWEVNSRRERKIHQRRTRRGRFGELIQADGSPHAWLEDRGPKCTLVIFIDDATSNLTAGRFVEAETTEAYQQILEEHLKKYGRPLGLYTDKHAIFRTSREASSVQTNPTHFARVLKDLDIELICAHSPQAKGRVERANGILQDRLIKEMRLRNICSIEEANAFLPGFIEEYNRKFGKQPRHAEDAHRSLRRDDNLERLFAHRAMRKLSKSLSFQYEGTIYQLQPTASNRFSCTHVTVFKRPGKPLLVEGQGKAQPYVRWEEVPYEQPKVIDSKELETYWPDYTRKKPGRRHPWR